MSDHVAYNKTLLKPPENFIWLVINDDNHMTRVISRLYCQNLITFEALKGLKKKLFGLFSGCRLLSRDSDSESGCNEPQAEEGEEKDATESTTPQSPVRYCVNPAHVKAPDEEAKRILYATNTYLATACMNHRHIAAKFISVEPISMFEDTTHSPQDLVWDDEAEDDTVDNMVRLIKESSVFKKTT
ncbi:hypothetical protein YC2023_086195 [Brassica napus]